VRAKTSTTAANLQTDSQRTDELQDLAREYLVMARKLLQPPPACLIAIGGFSGSGKSTLARVLAALIGAVPGAVVIRSDETRKQLCGVDPLARSEHRRLDASDADAAVIRQQHAQDLGTIAWRQIDASRTLEDVLRTATAMLSEHLKSGVVRLASQPA
jgi:predicted kinase